MDCIAAMGAFVRVVEAGNFARAADSLNVPTATISRPMHRLEHHLQVRLLHRTTRSITVTKEGKTHGRIVRLLTDLADVESSTKHLLSKPDGRVRVVSRTSSRVGDGLTPRSRCPSHQ